MSSSTRLEESEIPAPRAGVTYIQIVRLPAEGLQTFLDYEERVLSLMPDHGGRLDRRLRSADGLIEVHLVWFPSTDAFERYRDDPRRAEHAHLLAASGASTELLQLSDVV